MTCKGLLCIYLIDYLNPAAPNVCTPVSGSSPLQYFESEPVTNEESVREQPPKVVSSQNANNSQNLRYWNAHFFSLSDGS